MKTKRSESDYTFDRYEVLAKSKMSLINEKGVKLNIRNSRTERKNYHELSRQTHSETRHERQGERK